MNVTCIKIHSIILSFTCHGLRNFPLTHTHPLKTSCEFSKPYELLFSELGLLIKCWLWIGIKIHSIILSFTCHGLMKLCPCSYTSPQNHLWIFETLWVIIFWVRITNKMLNVNWDKNSFNNIIFHLSWLEKLSPTHTHPLKTICEFSKPYKLLIFELELLIKCWIWIGKKFTQ